MPFAVHPHSTVPHPSLAALLASHAGAPTRVFCTGGVVWAATGDERWRAESAHVGDGAQDAPSDAPPALGLAAVERWLATHAVRPVALSVPDGGHGERLALLSAVGATGWRPPLDELGARGEAGISGELYRAALRLRPLVDAAEQHALDAITRYAAAAATAARVARLLDASALETVGAGPGLFVAVDALASAGMRTLAAAEGLAERVYGEGLLGAPPTLRVVLLEVRTRYAAPAVVWRRALRRQAAASLGPPSVRVHRVRLAGGAAWAVRVPVAPAPAAPRVRSAATPAIPATVDAFEAAWALATEGWRALAFAIYAVAGAWAFD